MLEHALRLAALGFHVFPLIDGGKLPRIDRYPERATRDTAQITAWWTDRVTGWEQPWNIGISTTKFGDHISLLVVDVDVKKGKDGNETIAELEILGDELPATHTQTTPTGGRHLVYSVDRAVKQNAGLLGPGLDIRSRGGFIVGAGSVIAGKREPYKGSSVPIAPAPQWLIDRCGYGKETKADTSPPVEGVDTERAFARAQKYLAGLDTVSSGSRNEAAYRAAAVLRDYGVTQPEVVALMQDEWKCEPILEHDEIIHVVNSVFDYARGVAGGEAPETQFPLVVAEPDKSGAKHPFDKLNDEFAFVMSGGGHHILWETTDVDGKFKLEHVAESSFHRRHAAQVMQVNGKQAPTTEQWIISARRRSFDGIAFAPEKQCDPRFYNLWRGFAVTPNMSPTHEAVLAVDLWFKHLKENVCRGDIPLARYLTSFFAHIVQRPCEKPLVACVFKGAKGTGKNALVEQGIGHILGSHFMVAADRRFLVGNFNGHLENLLAIVLDEAFWSKDKQAEGVLKSLITGSSHNIEHKGKEAYSVANLVRVFILGNEDWVVPASHDERRYAVFDVGDGNKLDTDFFTKMRTGMENGGAGLLLRRLLDYDITDFNLNVPPVTAALLEQKEESLDQVEKWWLASLSEGYIAGSDFGGEWPKTADTSRLRIALSRFSRESGVRKPLPDPRSIGRTMRKFCPSLVATKRRDGTNTVNVYKVPSLEVARLEWDAFIGHETTWD